MINELAKQIHQNAIAKGFYENQINIGEKLYLVHSEVSEALEAVRKDHYTKLEKDWHIDGMADPNYGFTFNDNETFKNHFEHSVKNTFEDELADTIILVLDLCAYMNINIESHIKAKMRYNSTRPHKHGKNF